MKLAAAGLLLAALAFVALTWPAWHVTGPAGLAWLGCAPVAAFGAPALGVKSLDWMPYQGRHR